MVDPRHNLPTTRLDTTNKFPPYFATRAHRGYYAPHDLVLVHRRDALTVGWTRFRKS